MKKERIIDDIKRTAAENGGVPLGQGRFAKESGITVGVWRGKFWGKWSEAVQEAGFEPNHASEGHAQDVLVRRLAELTREHGRFPTDPELRLAKRADTRLPTAQAFNRLGSKAERIELVRAYATEHPEYKDVLATLPPLDAADITDREQSELGDGSVYLLKLGKHYKVGMSFDVPRRHRQIALELPEKPDAVHVIATDDPSGIEAYWHKRFASKRTNGEWFALTRIDVRAFKRRKFM